MKSYLILGLVLFASLLYVNFGQADGQTASIAKHVVINEVDINPAGNDAKNISEWVELYNPTDKEVNIGGWSVASTTVLKKTFTVPQGTIIKPGQFLAFSYTSLWFTDVSETVQLKNIDGVVIDQTPKISDLKNDLMSWQRQYDGFDTDSTTDWIFKTSTAGSTNGKLKVTDQKEDASVTVSVDKDGYIFNEKAIISGKVSERVFVEKPFFTPEQLVIQVSGPKNFYKTISLYPDLYLKYKTELDLRKVLGVDEGKFKVSVKYAGSTAETEFFVGDEKLVLQEKEQAALFISSDKVEYLPGENVYISAYTSKIIPFEGLKFFVVNPDGKTIFAGSLFPDTSSSKSSVRGGALNFDPNADFTTKIFLDIIKPVYGTYKIIADYSSLKAEATFEVVSDIKEDKQISLSTNKKVYGLGDAVQISGRLNKAWISSFDLEILQTGQFRTEAFGRGALDQDAQGVLKILDAVRLKGDSTFSYSFIIPQNTDRYGDYKVRVFKDIGEETIFFKVVENPDEYVDTDVPFSIYTDKTVYDIGETLVVFGKVSDTKKRTSFETPVVDISIVDEKGAPLTIAALKTESKVRTNNPLIAGYSFTAIPDIAGNYKVDAPLPRNTVFPGTYFVKANFDDGRLKATTSFVIQDPLVLTNKEITATLDKEVYGLGETVKLSGLVAAQSAEPTLTITLTKPSGNKDTFGTTIDSSKFSWSWNIPLSDRQNVKSADDRSKFTSNYGIYKVAISSQSERLDLFFKVSQNPDTDVLQVKGLEVSTDKQVYQAGDKLKVTGKTAKREQGTQGLVVQERAHIMVKTSLNKIMHESFVYLDNGGQFQSTFELPVTRFPDGTYKVLVTYMNLRGETQFDVQNNFITGGTDKISLIFDTDRNEYYLGDTVSITGKTSRIISLDNVRLGVMNQKDTEINCGSFVCGIGVPIVTLRLDPSGSFSHEHKVPSKSSSIGNYVIRIDTEFGTFSKTFSVVERPVEMPKLPEPEVKETPKIIDKFNRITNSTIPIIIEERTLDGKELFPRVIQGSLITPVRGQELNVNIQVNTGDGLCVIGQNEECLVSDSTRVPGSIYKVVEIDGKNYNVRYTGPDVRLEKFSILPESSDEILPDLNWTVEIIKENQPTSFYYKISYSAID